MLAEPLNPVLGNAADPLPMLASEVSVIVSVKVPPAQAAAMPETVIDVICPELFTEREKVNPSGSQALIELLPAPSARLVTPRLAAAAKVAAAAVTASRTKTMRPILIVGRSEIHRSR
jgi:hypothetical protein